MLFSLTVAGGVFLQQMDTIYNNLNFCTAIADDMIIWGEEVDGSDHDKHVTEVQQVTRQHTLKLNIDKLQFTAKQGFFFSTTFTSNGHKPEDDNIKAFNQMPQPTKVKRYPRFLRYGQLPKEVLF